MSLLPRYLYCLANSNVWGHTHAEELETLHCKFCKFTRGVPKTTTNLACYGELGKNPIASKKEVVPSKVLAENCQGLGCIPALVKDAYILTMNNSLHWVNFSKQILDDTSFSYAWFQPTNLDHTRFIAELEQRLTDQYKQN